MSKSHFSFNIIINLLIFRTCYNLQLNNRIIELNKIIDKYTSEFENIFEELILNVASLDIGFNTIEDINRPLSISVKTGLDSNSEPIFYENLKKNKDTIRNNVNSLYQNKMITKWHDLIEELFEYFVEEHFKGNRSFIELKKRKINIDFSLDIKHEEQIKDSIIKDFSFDQYGSKFKLINKILNPDNKNNHLEKVLLKHVQIRNSIQHYNNIAYSDIFKIIGLKEFTILDHNAKEIKIKENDYILINIPELFSLKKALVHITLTWRSENE